MTAVRAAPSGGGGGGGIKGGQKIGPGRKYVVT